MATRTARCRPSDRLWCQVRGGAEGSVERLGRPLARGEETEQSDVDLLVELDADVGLVGLAGLAREIGDVLGADVDVVPADSLKPAMRDQVLAEAIPL